MKTLTVIYVKGYFVSMFVLKHIPYLIWINLDSQWLLINYKKVLYRWIIAINKACIIEAT